MSETEAEARARREQACVNLYPFAGEPERRELEAFIAGSKYGERHATRAALEQARDKVHRLESSSVTAGNLTCTELLDRMLEALDG